MPNSNTTVVEGLMHDVRQLKKDVADLNRLLRDVGWGQGEIDTAAVVSEENEQLRAALRKLVKVAEQVRTQTSTLFVNEYAEEIEAPGCWWCGGNGCREDCPAMTAIAEAERLLGDAT